MKIHYTTPSWHGGFHEFMAKAFRSLGHEVFYFDDGGSGGQKFFRRVFTRIPRREYWADDVFRGMVSKRWIKSVVEYKPDLIVIEHAPNVMPEAIKKVRKLGYTVFYWDDSPPAGSQAKDLLLSMKMANEVFIVDRAREWTTILFSSEDFHFLPLAGDPDIFHPLPNIKKEYDIVYVGSFSPQTGDAIIRSEIICNIPDKYKVAVFGNNIDYWFKYYPKLKSRTLSVKAIPAKQVNEVYNKSKIVLGIYTPFHIESVSARTHETALSGAFQIVDWRRDLDELYPKSLIPRFRYAKEINGLIDYWINRDLEREEIARKVRDYALAHNTWRHRAEAMIGLFENKYSRL